MRAGQPGTGADILPRLHEEFYALDCRHLGTEPLDHLVGRHLALVVRLQLNEHPTGVFGRIEGGCAGKIKDAANGRILPDDVAKLMNKPGHLCEGGILTRLRLAENEAGILLREKPERNFHIEKYGHKHQQQGCQQHQQELSEHWDSSDQASHRVRGWA